MDSAGAALAKPAAEARAAKFKVVAQHIEQRHIRVVVADGHADPRAAEPELIDRWPVKVELDERGRVAAIREDTVFSPARR